MEFKNCFSFISVAVMKYTDPATKRETEGLFQLPVLAMVHTAAKPQQGGGGLKQLVLAHPKK